MTSLARAKRGRWRIIDILRPAVRRRLIGLGIFIGDTIEILKAGPGPVIFLKDTTRVAVGYGMAHAILVEPDSAAAAASRRDR